jgi:hypothetical protein
VNVLQIISVIRWPYHLYQEVFADHTIRRYSLTKPSGGIRWCLYVPGNCSPRSWSPGALQGKFFSHPIVSHMTHSKKKTSNVGHISPVECRAACLPLEPICGLANQCGGWGQGCLQMGPNYMTRGIFLAQADAKRLLLDTTNYTFLGR